MKTLPQTRAPLYEAMEKLKKRRVVPFDVPGHKRGRGNPELVRSLGSSAWGWMTIPCAPWIISASRCP